MRLKKLLKEMHDLTWTLAGSFMVFITLSGPTLNSAIKITVIAAVIHLVGQMIKKDDE